MLDWNMLSSRYHAIAPYLDGEFTCTNCGSEFKTWYPFCFNCEIGTLLPLPLIPEEREFLFPAADLLRVIEGRPWGPRALITVGIKPLILRSYAPVKLANFIFRYIDGSGDISPVSMVLEDKDGNTLLEAEHTTLGEVPVVQFRKNEYKENMPRAFVVRLKATIMIPLELFKPAT